MARDRQGYRLRAIWLLVIFSCFVAGVLMIFSDSQPSQAADTGGANYSPVPAGPVAIAAPGGAYKVIGWNDLGMHCMNENYSNMAILPPFNTMWAQVVQQGDPPAVITSNVSVQYNIIDNTYSGCGPKGCKSNFWQYAGKLFPGSAASGTENVGLYGATLSGTMANAGDHFTVLGIPLTPYLDSAPAFTPTNWYPYQRAHMVARDGGGNVLAETVAVAPVSTEMHCDNCHAKGKDPGGAYDNVEMNILAKHDEDVGTHFSTDASLRPVLCASCHKDNALGTPGNGDAPSMSFAMHDRHRFITTSGTGGTSSCYNCHPGQQTQCLRDVMYQQGMTCTNCHGDTANVADTQLAPTSREAWKQEPSCAQSGCHSQQYAPNANTLYRNSVGHGGMYCEACHGSPHAILPTLQPNDAIQNIALQGHAGVLSDCRVCHSQPPTGAGPHGIGYWSSVSGQITTTTGLALAQVTVSTQNALAASSSITGNYSLANMGPGVYTLTPQLAGYTFVPPYRVVTVPASRVRQDFQAFAAHSVAYLPFVIR